MKQLLRHSSLSDQQRAQFTGESIEVIGLLFKQRRIAVIPDAANLLSQIMMDYSVCWNWIQSLNMIVTSFRWNQPIEFFQNTLICDGPRYFRREWNQRSRENTDFAVISTATKGGYQRWSHCHKHVLQATVKNIPRQGRDSTIDLNLDSEMVENLLRILYIRQYVSVASVTDYHHLVLRFAEQLQLVPDRMTAIRNYLRSEFHRFAFSETFLQLNENELKLYLNAETVPLQTVSDTNTVLRSLLSWSGRRHFCPPKPSSHRGELATFVTDIGQLLETIHGRLTPSADNNAIYSDSFERVFVASSEFTSDPADTCDDLLIVCSDNVKLRCRRKDLCRIEYFYSMLCGGFRESLQQTQLRLEMPSTVVGIVLQCIQTGAIEQLGPDELVELYTMFDYLQSDQLFKVLDNHFRKNLLTWITCYSEDELIRNISTTMMHRLLPFIFEDLIRAFGLRGYAFALKLLVKWIAVDSNRAELLVPIFSNCLDVSDRVEQSKKVVYESFDGCVHVFDGNTWAPCYWGDFDSSREGIYNYQVTHYKRRYLTHNFLRSNTIALHESLTGVEKFIVRHSEAACGYFVEMFDRVFFSAGQQHFVLTDDLEARSVNMPIVDDVALEPRCFDKKSRRVFFDSEKLGYWVELDDALNVIRQVEFGSEGVTTDHHFCVLEGSVFALRLGHESFILDESCLMFCPIDRHRQRCFEPETPIDLDLILPEISGVIYKVFKIENRTFLIVTEAVELTQARLRISETESDPKIVGFFRWCSSTHRWIDVLASSKIPTLQIQQTVVMNHPGVPLYARRPCHV